MVKYGFIVLLCILSGILIYTWIDAGRKKAAHIRNIEKLENTISELKKNNNELRKYNKEFKLKLTKGDEKFKLIKSSYDELEKKYKSAMENLGRSENLSNELRENTEILRKENTAIRDEFQELEKLLQEFLDN
jgi:chromosome segregation ATPase